MIFNSAPLMIIFVGLKMQVGHIQIILSDHVSLKIRNTSIKLDFSRNSPRVTRKQFLIDIDVALWQ